jgi:thiamine kinase-like enzyme
LKKENNNLFVFFEIFFNILTNLDTTLYIDKKNNIIIEKFIEGDIIKNEKLFNINFINNFFEKIKYIHLQKPKILKENIITKYIFTLTNYLIKKNIFLHEIILYKNNYDNLNLKENELYYNHNDLQKFNIIDNNGEIVIIDWEYSGYTYQYFDHCNFIVLLFYQYIIDYKTNNFDLYNYVIFLTNKYNIEKIYVKSLMLISCYTWILWSYVKYDLLNNKFYLDYKDVLIYIYRKIEEL